MIIPKKNNIEKYVLKYFMQKRFILCGNTIKISLKSIGIYDYHYILYRNYMKINMIKLLFSTRYLIFLYKTQFKTMVPGDYPF